MNLPESARFPQHNARSRFMPPLLLTVSFLLLLVALLSLTDPPQLPDVTPNPDPAKIAELDAEFGDLTDFGYFSGIESRSETLSDRLEAGCGPLYGTRNYQLLVGKTGVTAILTYAARQDDGLVLGNRPAEETWPRLILLEGFTAPTEWWNRPVTSTYYDTEQDFDGRVFAELSLWVPWPDPVDAVPCDTVAHKTAPWYWDGETYVEADYRAAILAADGFLDVVPFAESLSP